MIREVASRSAGPLLGGVTTVLLARRVGADYVVELATQPFLYGSSLSHRQWNVLFSIVVASVAFALALRHCGTFGRSETVADD